MDFPTLEAFEHQHQHQHQPESQKGCKCCDVSKPKPKHPHDMLADKEKLLVQVAKTQLLQKEITDPEVANLIDDAIEAGVDPTMFLEEVILSGRVVLLAHIIENGATVYGTNKLAALAAQGANEETIVATLNILACEGTMIDYTTVDLLAYRGFLVALQGLTTIFTKYSILYRRWLGSANKALADYDEKDPETQDKCRQCFRYCIEEALRVYQLHPEEFSTYGTEETGNSYSIGYLKRLMKLYDLDRIYHPAEIAEIRQFVSRSLQVE